MGAGKAASTLAKTRSTFNAIEELVAPKHLSAMTSSVISRFQAALRDRAARNGEPISEYTIHGHLAELRKTLRWAWKLGLIPKMPHIEFPRRVGGMKGRPITGEELDRYLLAVPKVITIPEFVDSWKHLIRGLWLSGLRLDETMRLHWTSDENLCPDFSRRRPMFRIQAQAEKGRQFRMLPITPDFAGFLMETPVQDRRGFVFHPLSRPRSMPNEGSHRPSAGHVGKMLTKIGRKAGIKVSATKDASAHDFRRAFGYRWSKLVMPKVLQELMRHKSIQTTMQFYVGQMAEDAADAVWNAAAREAGNTFTNTSPEHGPTNAAKTEENS